MVKLASPVLLNEVQLATYNELKRKAVDSVIQGNIVAEYKQNVISALVSRGVIKLFRGKHYKVTGMIVALKPPTVHRQPKVITPTETSAPAPSAEQACA